jgi:hypothetical protein
MLCPVRPKTPSSGQQGLRAELEKRGCDASDTQIERWSHWRTGGLVPRPVKHGKGRGSYSEYTDVRGAADRVCEVHELRGRLSTLDEVALVLTMHRRPLDPASVKEALLAVLERMRHQFVSHSPDPNDAFAVAHHAVHVLKQGRRNESDPPTIADSFTDDAAMAAAQLLAGDQLGPGQLTALVEGTPLAQIAAGFGGSAAEVTAAIEPHTGLANYTSMIKTVEAATPTAIVEALQLANNIIDTYFPSQIFATPNDRDTGVVGLSVSLLTMNAVEVTPPDRGG